MTYNTSEITLPSGATVILKDPRTLLVRDRNKVLENAGDGKGIAAAIGMQNGLIAVIVDSWSFDLLPPNVKISSLENLTPGDYEALLEYAMPAQKALFPSLTASEENIQDPKAIIANLNA